MQMGALGLVLGMAIGNVIHAIAFMFIILRTNWDREVEKALQQYGHKNDLNILKGGQAMQIVKANPDFVIMEKIDTSKMLELQIQNMQPIYDTFPAPSDKQQKESKESQLNDSAKTSRSQSLEMKSDQNSQNVSKSVVVAKDFEFVSQTSQDFDGTAIVTVENKIFRKPEKIRNQVVFNPIRSIVQIWGCLGFVLVLLIRSLQYDLQMVRAKISQNKRYY
eukprot:TRINITY_DN52522_c0_g1_i1.p2 TRINITY_DN52522_c0_g1~~TRINITY_DN52522_c0_g1_i1.p2  ORF type:complete len:258 (+),score=33.71 TRINITY_DN52522_c0_g1_i1:117-776(+)